MTEKELISKLQEFKQIKPRTEWVALAKNQILNTGSQGYKMDYIKALGNMLSFSFAKKLSYSFAALLFVAAGMYGLMNLQKANIPNDPSIALLAAEAEVENDFKILEEKSKTLMEAIEKEPNKVDEAMQETKVAVKNVTDSIKKEPSLAKKAALEVSKNRTYLNIAGSDELEQTYDTLFKTASVQLLEDLNNMVLPDDKKESLDKINESYNQGAYEGKYAVLIESILMFDASLDVKDEKVEEAENSPAGGEILKTEESQSGFIEAN